MANASTAVTQQLIPTGKLRVAVAVAPAPSAQFVVKDGNDYRGVAITLGRALAQKLGVEAEILVHNGSGEVQNSAASGKWDVAFMPVDEERKKFVDFGNAYHMLQSTYLVAPGVTITNVAGANTDGFRIGGIANTATFRASNRSAPKAKHMAFEKADAAVEALREGKLDAIAFSRESLTGLQQKVPGSRILDDAFMNSCTAVALPKNKPDAVAYASEFIDEAIGAGLVRRALDEMNLKASQVAPKGMKP